MWGEGNASPQRVASHSSFSESTSFRVVKSFSESRSFRVVKMHMLKYMTECNYIVDLDHSTGNEAAKAWE